MIGVCLLIQPLFINNVRVIIVEWQLIDASMELEMEIDLIGKVELFKSFFQEFVDMYHFR